MTTTIGFATRDCIVLGCDSLATSIQSMIDPIRFADAFFDNEGNLKMENGAPILQRAAQVAAFVRYVPRDQLPNVTKLYELRGIPAGLTFAGASVVGDESVKNLVDSFIATPDFQRLLIDENRTIADVAAAFFKYVDAKYQISYAGWPDHAKPAMTVLLAGYSGSSYLPEIYQLTFSANPDCRPMLNAHKRNDIVYSGQFDIIQRVVAGVDFQSYCNLNERYGLLLNRYRESMQAQLEKAGIDFTLPEADFGNPSFQLFGEGFAGVQGLWADRAALSEQAAINFVEFLVDTMIKAQQFSGEIPTVGGEVHIAIITKAGGFRWISKEEYLFRGHAVPKHKSSGGAV